MRKRFAMGWMCALVAMGCATREVSTVKPAPAAQQYRVVDATRPALDVLFVVDNSGSMREEQESLVANFPKFIDVIDSVSPLGRPNIHLGVISSDLGGPAGADSQCAGSGDGGNLINEPRVDTACSGPSDRFISDVEGPDGERVTNYAGTLAEAFSCIAQLGTEGCGFEQPLEAARRALANPINEGFFRDDAVLVVIFITDEDDCSMSDPSLMLASGECSDPFDLGACPLGPVSSFRCFEFGVECDQNDRRGLGDKTSCEASPDSAYLQSVDAVVDALLEHKPSDRLFVAGIAGTLGDAEVVLGGRQGDAPTLSPACSSDAGVAAAPYRLSSLLERFPHHDLRSICDSDLTQALEGIADRVGLFLGDPCVRGAVELSPDEPGIHVDCSLTDVVYEDGRASETPLPRCDNQDQPEGSNNIPCWTARVDSSCETETNIALRIERPEGGPSDAVRYTEARCAERFEQP